MKAVLTGDLVHSRRYSNDELSQVLDVLKNELDAIEGGTFRLFRGDSFQGVLDDVTKALQVALRIRTAITRVQFKDSKTEPDIRISIGIGTIDLSRDSILESNGSAFQHSGTALDAMKGDYHRFSLTTDDLNINGEFRASLSLLDSMMSKWGQASAEVVYFLNQDYREQQIAETVGISQAAVNARKKVVHWDAIKLLLERYTSVMQNLLSDGN